MKDQFRLLPGVAVGVLALEEDEVQRLGSIMDGLDAVRNDRVLQRVSRQVDVVVVVFDEQDIDRDVRHWRLQHVGISRPLGANLSESHSSLRVSVARRAFVLR